MNVNICYLITPNFIDLTLESIHYIRKFYRHRELELNITIVGSSEFNKSQINILNKRDIKYIQFPIEGLPICHQRAYLPEILNVDKFIFLDSDTVAMTCISKLWELPMMNNIIAACQHHCIPTFHEMRKRYKFNFAPFTSLDGIFFNCGVMVIDCNQWKLNMCTDKIKDVFETYRYTDHWKKDEPCFNVVLKDRWLVLNDSWNYFPRGQFKKANITHFYGQKVTQKPVHRAFIK